MSKIVKAVFGNYIAQVKGFLHLGLGLRVGQTYAEKDLVIRSK